MLAKADVPTALEPPAPRAERSGGQAARFEGWVLGDFELIEEIGRGATGVVYRARQQSLGREVAVKVLPVGPATSQREIDRFHREARAAGARQASGHRADLQRRPRRRRALLRDGVRARRRPRERARAAAQAVDRRPAAAPAGAGRPRARALRGAHRGRRGRGPAARPRERDRAPRHQAAQPVDRGGRPRAPGRLRAGARRSPGLDLPDRRRGGHAALHEPRAGARRARPRRPPHGRLLARRRALRALDAAAARSTATPSPRS